MIQLTQHARIRCQQRGIPRKAIEAAFHWGRQILLEKGRRGFYLGRKAIEEASKYEPDISEFLHTFIVISPDQWVVTAIQTPHLRKVSKKGKHRRHHVR